MTELSELLALIEQGGEDLADWLGKAEAEVESRFGSEIGKWKEALLQGEYGCWCGPGSRCTEDVDAMDGCCHQHDLAYDSLGLDFGSMWSPSAIVKAHDADHALLECVKAGPEPADAAGQAYRAVLIAAFEARAAIADLLKVL